MQRAEIGGHFCNMSYAVVAKTKSTPYKRRPLLGGKCFDRRLMIFREVGQAFIRSAGIHVPMRHLAQRDSVACLGPADRFRRAVA